MTASRNQRLWSSCGHQPQVKKHHWIVLAELHAGLTSIRSDGKTKVIQPVKPFFVNYVCTTEINRSVPQILLYLELHQQLCACTILADLWARQIKMDWNGFKIRTLPVFLFLGCADTISAEFKWRILVGRGGCKCCAVLVDSHHYLIGNHIGTGFWVWPKPSPEAISMWLEAA